MAWNIVKTKHLQGEIVVLTGLHIGSSAETMEISGMDNPIIRNPANGEPYIPGSSIKGKMRHLLEWHTPGKLREDGKPYEAANNEEAKQCPITRVFGHSADRKLGIGPTRLVVHDAFLTDKYREILRRGEMPVVEEKSENSINRITAMANPRPMERVVPGVRFGLSMFHKIIDTGDGGQTDQRFFAEVVLRGLALLELDYLGGCGSRGCGRVFFDNLADEAGTSLMESFQAIRGSLLKATA